MIENTHARYIKFLVDEFFDTLSYFMSEDFIPYSEEDLETLYAIGYNFFMYGKYKAAKDIFTSLTGYASHTSHYWRALGATNQHLKDYAGAISAYDRAIAINPNDVISYIYRGESKLLAGKKEAGLEDLKKVLEVGAEDPQFALWLKRAKLLIRLNKES